MKKDNNALYIFTIVAAVLVLVVAPIFTSINSASFQRTLKTIKSERGGGLHRTVTVYSMDGTPIRSWTGKFDVVENDQETWFDISGKRVIIQGGIVINEEE